MTVSGHSVSVNVLVVDDDLVMQATMGAYLEEAGFTVHEAHDGAQGLEVFAGDTVVDTNEFGEVCPRLCEATIQVHPPRQPSNHGTVSFLCENQEEYDQLKEIVVMLVDSYWQSEVDDESPFAKTSRHKQNRFRVRSFVKNIKKHPLPPQEKQTQTDFNA